MSTPVYADPIAERYASKRMVALFTPFERARLWRTLWIALAESQRELGLSISEAQVDELRRQRDRIDLEVIARHEKRLRHDVMAHIHAYGEVAPAARPILHLGATSCYVTDNGDLHAMREGLGILGQRLLLVIHALAAFARREADRPTLGLTHLQPAQLTTVGKRAALWLQDFVWVWESLERTRKSLPFRGAKGTTGTQASFLQLFGGDAERVRELDRRVARKMGFDEVFFLTGQTYPRLWDYRIICQLSELAVISHKFSTDLRLLQSWGELEEPREAEQVGSSAMPYKRNPMRSERLGSIAKVLMSLAPAVGFMAATQWFERTLDDSALRRVTLPQAFLAADALLIIARNICEGMRINARIAERRVEQHLPFIACEELLLEGTTAGGDRQDLHEKLRGLSGRASIALQEGAAINPLRSYLEADPEIAPLIASLPEWKAERFVGLAPEQTRAYLDQVIARLPMPADDGENKLNV